MQRVINFLSGEFPLCHVQFKPLFFSSVIFVFEFLPCAGYEWESFVDAVC